LSFRVPDHDLAPLSGSLVLPVESARSGMILSFDASGLPVMLDPANLSVSGVGDTLPIDSARAIVFQTGATSRTLKLDVSAYTAARTITAPDANVNLGLLAALSAAAVSGDIGKALIVSGTGAAVAPSYPVGHFAPGVTTRGDADYT